MTNIVNQEYIDNMETRGHFDRTERTIWFGPEIEYTRHFGRPTLCIRGVPPVEKLNSALERFPKIDHMFFGGPYENEKGLFQDENELSVIQSYLDAGQYVTVQALPTDMNGNLLEFFMKNKDNENLCIFVPCQIPNLKELGARVDVKLDDPGGVGGPNGGVWVMSADQFKESSSGYTDWSTYDVDILID